MREPQVGIEPTTARLRIECSTPELLWRDARAALANALARTRTATPCGTTPSRWRVYQFHHQGPTNDEPASHDQLSSYRLSDNRNHERFRRRVLSLDNCPTRERRGSNPRPLE